MSHCVLHDLQLTCGANVVANGKVCRPRSEGVCEDDALCSNTSPLCPENPLKTDTSFVSTRLHSFAFLLRIIFGPRRACSCQAADQWRSRQLLARRMSVIRLLLFMRCTCSQMGYAMPTCAVSLQMGRSATMRPAPQQTAAAMLPKLCISLMFWYACTGLQEEHYNVQSGRKMRWILGHLPRESSCSSIRWEGRQCMSCWLRSNACAKRYALKIVKLAHPSE